MIYWNLTVNLLTRYHRTIKDILATKGRRFCTVLKFLIDIATHRLLIRTTKELESEIRFPTIKLTPTLENLRDQLTPCGWDLVLQQAEKPTTSYQWTRVSTQI